MKNTDHYGKDPAIWAFLLLLLITAAGCGFSPGENTQDEWEQTTLDIPAAAFVSTQVGDSVVTITETPYYDRPNGTQLGTIPEGTPGEVTRRKSGWAKVDFNNGVTGVAVEEFNLDFYDGGGDPPDPLDPVAAFTFSAAGLQVNFFDQSTDPDGTIVAWLWDFGNGTSSGSPNPTVNYSNSGTFQVSLTVTDNDGRTDTELTSISVSDNSGGGDYKLVIVGFSNTRQIIQGTPPGYDIGQDIPLMGGNAIPAYGDDGARNYNQGVSVVQQAVAQNPDADGFAIMVGHRYADPDRYPGREGFRWRDVVEILFPPESGSVRYSEIEYMENAGALMDQYAPGKDHFFIPLHRYSTPTCERLAVNTVGAIELMIAEAVNLGYASPLTLNGQQYRLPEMTSTPGNDISGDQCHLSAAGVQKAWDDPTWGLRKLLDSL